MEDRRNELRSTRQMWLESSLGYSTPTIILYGEFMEQKIRDLQKTGEDRRLKETYFIDKETGEKWIREHPDSDTPGSSPQLRKVYLYPYEEEENHAD